LSRPCGAEVLQQVPHGLVQISRQSLPEDRGTPRNTTPAASPAVMPGGRSRLAGADAIAEIDLVKAQSRPLGVQDQLPVRALRSAGEFNSMWSTGATDASRGDGASAGRTEPDSDYGQPNPARSLAFDHFGCRMTSARDAISCNAGSTGTVADRRLQVMAR